MEDKKLTFVIPFDEMESEEWKLFFPFKTVHHYGQKIEFTPKRGAEMVSNFGVVPDYDLPINTLHDDSLGVFGRIKALRIGDFGIEWQPEFDEGAVEKIKEKGYKYASPEVWFDGYPGVDGEEYDNVALGIAITPRPRLGRDTLVFSDGEWTAYEGAPKDTEETMPEEITVELNDEQMGELKEGIFAQIGKWLFGRDEKQEPEQEPEPEQKPEPVELKNEDGDMEFEEKLQEKDAEIVELKEKLEKMEELEDKAQKYDEQLRLAEEEAEKERQEKRRLEFAETAKEIHGLPEMETDFAEELMWLEDADESEDKVHFNAIMNVLRALGNQQKAAKLFGEFGNDGDNAKPVGDRIEALVAAKVEEGKSAVDAYSEVFRDNPGLYDEYDKQNTLSLQEKRE